MANYSGVSGDATWGATALAIVSWNAKVSVEPIDVTNKTHEGFQTMIGDGKKKCDASVEGKWDDSNSAHTGNPPSLRQGQIVALTLDMPDASNESISGTFLCVDVEYDNPDGTDAVSIKANFTSSGPFYLPGESAS